MKYQIHFSDEHPWRPGLAPYHEALHSVVTHMVGGRTRRIVLWKCGHAYHYTASFFIGWRKAAIDMAAGLIGDASYTDIQAFRWYSPGQQAYAKGWLLKNRRRIMRRARRLMKKMGQPPGVLEFNLWTGKQVWRNYKRRK